MYPWFILSLFLQRPCAEKSEMRDPALGCVFFHFFTIFCHARKRESKGVVVSVFLLFKE